MEDKSLKEYLINIENNTEKKVISLKEVCGEPFEDYLKDSEYYVIEPFERKIKDFKNLSYIKIIILFSLSCISFIGSFFLKSPYSIIEILLSLLLAIVSIVDFFIIFTQKPKMNIKKWNCLAKFEFYFSDKRIELMNGRSGNGTILSAALSIIRFLALAGLVVVSLVNGFDVLVGPIMCLVSAVLLYFVSLLAFSYKYYYTVVMVDKKDSYLVWSPNDIKKVEKK